MITFVVIRLYGDRLILLFWVINTPFLFYLVQHDELLKLQISIIISVGLFLGKEELDRRQDSNLQSVAQKAG